MADPNSEQGFVSSTLAAIIGAGWVEPNNYSELGGATAELSLIWRAQFAGIGAHTRPVVPQRQVPLAQPAQPASQPVAAPAGVPSGDIQAMDLSTFAQWGQRKVGVGNIVCSPVGKPWRDCTWEEVIGSVVIDDTRGSDWTYLAGFLCEKLKNETADIRETTACAKAARDEIRRQDMGETPFG